MAKRQTQSLVEFWGETPPRDAESGAPGCRIGMAKSARLVLDRGEGHNIESEVGRGGSQETQDGRWAVMLIKLRSDMSAVRHVLNNQE